MEKDISVLLNKFKNLSNMLHADLKNREQYEKGKPYIRGRYDMMSDILLDIDDYISEYEGEHE